MWTLSIICFNTITVKMFASYYSIRYCFLVSSFLNFYIIILIFQIANAIDSTADWDIPNKNVIQMNSKPSACTESYNDDGNLQVICKNINLGEEMQNLPIDTAILNVHTCDITSCCTDSGKSVFVRFSKLLELQLQNCLITNLHQGMFENLTSLVTIDLSENQIVSLAEKVFEGAPNIENVILSSNDIEDVYSVTKALSGLKKLKMLTLSKNSKIYKIQKLDFVPLNGTYLQELDVSTCKIARVDIDSFEPVMLLKSLDFSHNPLDMTSLRNVTLALKNRSIHNLVLRNLERLNGFPVYPIRELKNTSINSLDMSLNDFQSIPNRALSLNKLKILKLLDSKISTINPEAFFGASGLETVDLKRNRFSSLNNQLQWSTELRVVDLSEQQTTKNFYMVENGFKNLKNLQMLALDRVPIRGNITRYMFNGLENLETLGLSGNGIQDIEDLSFASMTCLKTLDLTNNEITDLRVDMFFNLTSLVNLSLKKNRITFQTGFEEITLFTYTPKLEILNLDENDIMYIPPNLCDGLIELHTLSIQMNELQPWKKSPFTVPHQLRLLLLAYNQITVVTPTMLESLRNLVHLELLDLSHNPFDCTSCELHEFKSWINSTDVKLMYRSESSTYVCAIPKDKEGVDIEHINLPLCYDSDDSSVVLASTTPVSFEIPDEQEGAFKLTFWIVATAIGGCLVITIGLAIAFIFKAKQRKHAKQMQYLDNTIHV